MIIFIGFFHKDFEIVVIRFSLFKRRHFQETFRFVFYIKDYE